MDAVPELDQRMAVKPDEWDVAADRLVDERLGGRPERLLLGEPDEPLHLRGEIEEDRRIVWRHEVVDQPDGHLARLEADRLLATDRLAKEAVHEAGHVLGLTHCDDYECVMASSHAVEWLDLKTTRLCDSCHVSIAVDGLKPVATS